MAFSAEELRTIAILADLPDEQIEWVCRNGERYTLEAGDRMFERGKPADALWIVVSGTIQGFEVVNGQWMLVATTRAGEVTGMLPFSRMTHYPRHTVAAEPSEVIRLDASLLPELISVSYELGGRLVAQMSDRVRGDVRLEQQSEKMMALGRLSAGLAHELNNPAAAVQRAAARLIEHRKKLPGLAGALMRHDLGGAGIRELARFWGLGAAKNDLAESVLDQSAREEELLEWLEARGIAEPWDVAGSLGSATMTTGDLQALSDSLPPPALEDALLWLACGIDSDRLVAEVHTASARISELIASVKMYSRMDRSPAHRLTDIRRGVDSTLTMLDHKLKEKSIIVECDFEADLPEIPANEGELNQIWTNLIDNAIDAMSDGGHLSITGRRNDIWIEVQVVDDGQGISSEILPQIFEPFFTTKDVGVGTGLGLGIAQRIARTHQGRIEVASRPGETIMRVRLPLNPATPD